MSTSNNPPITVAEAAALPDETWLNDGLTAHVLEVKTVPKKAGGNFWSVSLSDGGQSQLAVISSFTAPKYVAGDNIKITGTGIMKKTYNGKAQITYGSKATVEVIRGATGIQKAVEAHQEKVHTAHAQEQNGAMINGNAVGNSMTNMWENARHIYSGPELKEQMTSPAFWDWFYNGCSDHLRIGRALEAGKLREPVSQRSGRSSPRPSTVEEELGAEEPSF